MIVIRRENGRKLCRTCGADITEHARYRNWTQCELCYWKDRLKYSADLETLIKDRADLKEQKQTAYNAHNSAKAEMRDRERLLLANAPWWKKTLGIDIADNRLRELRVNVGELAHQLLLVERDFERVESSIKTARHYRKRFESAARQAAVSRKRREEAQQRKQDFDANSARAVCGSYDRLMFRIRKKDYKRGNPLDNHFRNQLLEKVLDAADSKCLFCGSTHDLTLDHFGIPKNEGGNFTLLLQNGTGVRINVVVLCRSCNASKGELPYDEFFEASKIDEAMIHQRRLLDLVLGDRATLAVIESWYGVRIG